MKRLFIVSLALVLTTGIVFGRRFAYDHTKPPRLGLPAAYSLALQGLGSATNQFYCYDARCLVSASPDGEWVFAFSNTNGALKTVTVCFDKRTSVIDGQPIY